MWGEPRKGTEADLVKQEVEKRKKIAKDKGLDRLVIDVYHDCLKYYPSWIENEKNKKWVLPQVFEAKIVGKKFDSDIEFKIKDKSYKITRGDRWTPEFGEGTWYKLTLYQDNKKVFETTEEETNDQYCTYYSPVSVDAYLNDNWVDDFNSILSHKKDMDAQSAIKFAENPERTRELRESFGIDKIESNNQNVDEKNNLKNIKENNINKSIWSKWWVWVIIIIVLSMLFN